jgi:hypothetical protein
MVAVTNASRFREEVALQAVIVENNHWLPFACAVATRPQPNVLVTRKTVPKT